MNIVYALTSNFVKKAEPSMRSVLEHNPKAKIYLLTDTDKVEGEIPMTVIDVSGQDFFSPNNCCNLRNNFGGYINLLKVAYSELLPKLNKVIHLDADTIVTESLEPLWKTNIKGKWVAAVPEYKGKYHPFGEMYYNMGVALLNLQQIRADGIVQDMVEYLRTIKTPFVDQDAWNYYGIMHDKFVPLDIRWNENFATGYTDEPAIVHYCGRFDWYDNPKVFRHEYLEKYV
jgi:lipopolysaccharide biosynthesis glycosyltransferase